MNDQGSTAVEAYDPSSDTWEPLMALPTARDGGAAAAFLDGRVHVVGGADYLSGETHPEHEIYDAASRTWTTGPDLPTPRQSMGSVVVDGRWYTIDGAQLATISVSNVVEVLVP